MDQALVRYLPTADDKNALYNATILVPFAGSILITFVFLMGLVFLAPALVFLRQPWFFLTFIVNTGVYALYMTQSSALVALRRSDLNLAQTIVLGLRAAFVLALASIGLMGLFVSYDLALVLSVVFASFPLYHYGLTYKVQIRRSILRQIGRFSLGNYTATIIFIAPSSIMPVIILNTVGANGAAYFYIAYSIASFLYFFPSSVSTSLFVEGSHAFPLTSN